MEIENRKRASITHLLTEYKVGEINLKQCLKEIDQVYEHYQSEIKSKLIDDMGKHYGE